MITPSDLVNRAIAPGEITSRQREVLVLVRQYYAAAHELPSAGWLSRRLKISRATAHEHMAIVLEKLDPSRRR